MKPIYPTVVAYVTLRDALYNTTSASASSVDYGRGVVVGAVSALMAVGYDFPGALAVVESALPEDYRIACVPDCWRSDLA